MENGCLAVDVLTPLKDGWLKISLFYINLVRWVIRSFRSFWKMCTSPLIIGFSYLSSDATLDLMIYDKSQGHFREITAMYSNTPYVKGVSLEDPSILVFWKAKRWYDIHISDELVFGVLNYESVTLLLTMWHVLAGFCNSEHRNLFSVLNAGLYSVFFDSTWLRDRWISPHSMGCQ